MINAVKQKDEHHTVMKQAMNKIQNRDHLTTDEEDHKSNHDVHEDEISDVLSHIVQRGPAQKTEKQKMHEIKCLEAFLIECEKRNILTKQILKNLKDK